MCGGDTKRNMTLKGPWKFFENYSTARECAEEGTAIIEESRLEELRLRMKRALENDQSHTRRLSQN